MTKTIKAAPIPTFAPTLPSNKPGGYLDTPELERANDFGRMAFDIEQALADRNNVPEAMKAAALALTPEQIGQANILLQIIAMVEAGGMRVRQLEEAAERFVVEFKRVQGSYLDSLALKNPDASQIHASALAEKNKVTQHQTRGR